MFLVSSCLIGFPCRYNAVIQTCPSISDELSSSAVPVCPEVLGGLATPRMPSEISSGTGADVLKGTARVLNSLGEDVTMEYVDGARKALSIGLQAGCWAAILKARSPSCGAGSIYDGTFTHTRVSGDGVFAALLKANGFRVYTEEQLSEAMRDPAVCGIKRL
ncbi:MAG: DUF523 domain-containing protein [Bacillota bacterium]|jgi:uncharacterized protein YbbK (DUF523 family)